MTNYVSVLFCKTRKRNSLLYCKCSIWIVRVHLRDNIPNRFHRRALWPHKRLEPVSTHPGGKVHWTICIYFEAITHVPAFPSRHLQRLPESMSFRIVGIYVSGSVLSLVSTIEELLDRKVAAPVQKIENTAVGIRHADHVAPFIRKSWNHFADKRRSLSQYS
jgi:hypothetical protein